MQLFEGGNWFSVGFLEESVDRITAIVNSNPHAEIGEMNVALECKKDIKYV